MRLIRQVALTAMAVLVAAVPAAAQEPAWIEELEERIERHAEAFARMVENQVRGRGRIERDRDRGPEIVEQFSRTVRLGRNGTLDLENIAGDIIVSGGGGDQVRIDATKRARSTSDASARALMQELEITAVERGGNVEVRTRYPRRRGTSASVDFTVSVPSGANVTLRTISGDVRVTNVRGDVRAESTSGDIVASADGRLRQLRSISGTLQISDGEAGDIEGSTVSGDVIVRNVRVRRLDLSSVSGDMRFADVESDRVNMRSVSGSIDYAGRLARSGRYEIQTHSGDLRVTPVGDSGFELEANTFSGNVRSDYALTLGPQLGLTNSRNRGVRGTFGEAGAALVLQSFSGNITIVRR